MEGGGGEVGRADPCRRRVAARACVLVTAARPALLLPLLVSRRGSVGWRCWCRQGCGCPERPPFCPYPPARTDRKSVV